MGSEGKKLKKVISLPLMILYGLGTMVGGGYNFGEDLPRERLVLFQCEA
jgi:hypothetical protein